MLLVTECLVLIWWALLPGLPWLQLPATASLYLEITDNSWMIIMLSVTECLVLIWWALLLGLPWLQLHATASLYLEITNNSWMIIMLSETECSILSPAAGITLTPTTCYSQPVFGDNCLFSCTRTGFTVMPLGSDYVTCLNNGQWSRNISNIHCAG